MRENKREAEARRRRRDFPGLPDFGFRFYCFPFPPTRTLCVIWSRRYAYEVRHVIFHFGKDFSFMRKVNAIVRKCLPTSRQRSDLHGHKNDELSNILWRSFHVFFSPTQKLRSFNIMWRERKAAFFCSRGINGMSGRGREDEARAWGGGIMKINCVRQMAIF